MNIDTLRDYAVLDGERLRALWTTLDACTRALELVRPFMAEDFPHGPNKTACVTEGYREAYRALVAALEQARLDVQTPLENYIGSLGVTLQPDEAENWTCPRCQHQTSTMLTRCYVCGTPRGVVQPTGERG